MISVSLGANALIDSHNEDATWFASGVKFGAIGETVLHQRADAKETHQASLPEFCRESQRYLHLGRLARMARITVEIGDFVLA
jgi:hypothetical protein